MTHKDIEVRCCCNPEVLLGTIQIPERLIKRGKLTLGQIEIEIEEYFDPVSFTHTDTYLAVKSNEVPLEVWETIPGFKRNPQ